MIDLKSKPFYLNDQQIRKVQSILDSMTLDEKIGQVFCPIGSSFEEKEIVEFIEKYKPGAMMYRPLESTKIKHIHETIQNYSKIPLMLAANLESGGNGICIDGTYFSRQMGVAATNDLKQAYHLGMIAGKEANAVLCNWSFAPIVDIDFNYLNPITNIRTYGSDKEKVIAYAKQQINALREYNVIPCIKHFPGDGVDMRDQHLVSSVNDLTVKQWDESYGNIYSSFIDEGVETIMVGHMLLPHYVKYFNPTIKDEDILPASLSKEVLTNLLREKLSFNGMVVTDATAMIGYNVALPRSQAIPLSIENGCDMILFNKDIDEDYTFMKNALLAILLITPIFAILGTMIVNNKMAFFSDALGHSALTGIAIGMLLGISNINISMILFAVIFALLLNFIKNKTTYGADTIISVFSSIAIALGLAILAQTGNFNKYSSYLVGDILSITPAEILYLFITFIAIMLFWYFMFNKLNVISINKTLAKSRGINTKLIDNIFVILIAVIVMISIRWIGILLINSLLILPAAASRNIAKNMRSYHLLSVIFSMFSGIVGLILSYYWNIPTGPMIVIISGIIYFVTFAKKLLQK